MLTATYDSAYIDYNYPTAISLASKLKHTYALKSGTTETDNWHIGFNNDIVTSVWIGYDNNKSLSTSEYKYGQNIWYKTIPTNVSSVWVDPISGKAVDENAKVKKLMYFIKGSEPTDTQDVFDEKMNSTKKN